jgi:hypothetical protein
MESEVLYVRILTPLKQALLAEAERYGRTMSDHVNEILRDRFWTDGPPLANAQGSTKRTA